jgi:MAF protein
MKQNKIILASTSPRRIEILKKNGLDPVIMPPKVEESLPSEITMEQAVMYLALKKALNVEKEWLKGNNSKESPTNRAESGPPAIIAADTVVYKNGIIGKPVDESDAVQILRLLKNTNHYVATGVAIVYPGTSERTVFCDITEVFFKDYSDKDIHDYVNTEEPWDKAGGYAIQGSWGKHVSHIIGDYDNVMGFPWSRIKHFLLNK